jgi:hypothetical protein
MFFLCFFFYRYYWNDVTEASQWDKPANLAWVKVKYEPPGGETRNENSDGEPERSEL